MPAGLLAPGRMLTLPRLTGVPRQYRAFGGDRVALRLGGALLDAGIAEPTDWARDGAQFIERTLTRVIAQHGGVVMASQFYLMCTLVQTSEDLYSPEARAFRDHDAAEDETTPVYLAIEADSAGFVVLGDTIRQLERAHPQLPATIVMGLLDGVSACVRVYDHRDARAYIEMLQDMYAGDPEDERPEIPDLAGLVPAALAAAPLTDRALAQVAANGRDPAVRAIIAAYRRFRQAVTHWHPPPVDEEFYEGLDAPLPCLLASFERHDDVVGCFDQEAESMYESARAPAAVIPLAACSPAGVTELCRHLGHFCDVLSAASTLIGMLPGNAPDDAERRV